MKKFFAAATLAIGLLMAGCATLTVPIAVGGGNEPLGPLVGQASGRIILGVFGTADAGIRAAAADAGITRVTSVDLTTQLGILGLWTTFTVTVTGY